MTEWLTKSKLISAYQCPKRLWMETHEAHLAAEGNSSEALFRMGREVGEVARTLYPGGHLIGHIRDPERAARDTQELIAKPGSLTLYEAAFAIDTALTRIDIFQRDELGHSRLVEVKASASVKYARHHQLKVCRRNSSAYLTETLPRLWNFLRSRERLLNTVIDACLSNQESSQTRRPQSFLPPPPPQLCV